MNKELKKRFFAIMAGSVLLIAGCVTNEVVESGEEPVIPPARSVRKADDLFQRAHYSEAIAACIEIARRDPLTPGLADLQQRITAKLNELRAESVATQDAASREAMVVDARRFGLLPETYGVRRHVIGETTDHITKPTRMQQLLDAEVSMHLENVSLTEIINQLAANTNVNIVVDGAIAERTITVHAENTPLRELLDFIGRNLEVSFSVGKSLIWATPRSPADSPLPFETRIYRLRKGLPRGEIPGSEDDGEPAMIEAVERFVPQPEGADIYFDTRSHSLLVKNTRENLAATDVIINTMDVRPLQVLIEARFVSTTFKDINELGVNWLFGRPAVKGELSASVAGAEDGSTPGVELLGKNLGIVSGSGSGLSAGYFGILDNFRLQAVVNALEQYGQGRTLTVPRLTTVNNKTATLRIGEDFRYYEDYDLEEVVDRSSSDNTTYVSRAVPSGDAAIEELGYELKVTPSVGADLSTINLTINPKISDVEDRAAWAAAYKPSEQGAADNFTLMGKLPIFKRKELEAEVVVRSGETVVLGGLVNTSQTKDHSGVPWFVRIPVLGRLFGTKTDNETADNLIIFVTATLLTDSGEDLVALNPRTLPGPEVTAAQISEELGFEE